MIWYKWLQLLPFTNAIFLLLLIRSSYTAGHPNIPPGTVMTFYKLTYVDSFSCHILASYHLTCWNILYLKSIAVPLQKQTVCFKQCAEKKQNAPMPSCPKLIPRLPWAKTIFLTFILKLNSLTQDLLGEFKHWYPCQTQWLYCVSWICCNFRFYWQYVLYQLVEHRIGKVTR